MLYIMYILIDCEEGAVRVVGGDGISYGTVEVCINGFWGLITDNSWDDKDGVVICRQLGFEANSNCKLGSNKGYTNSYYLRFPCCTQLILWQTTSCGVYE